MTVRELIDELESYDENMAVMFSYDSRDYLHSIICTSPSEVSEAKVEWSDYHNAYKYKGDTDDFYDNEEEESDNSDYSNTVVLLS